jgi:glycosyltransferase involved in cell wall biosynthesis
MGNIKVYYPKIKWFPFNILFLNIKVRIGWKVIEKLVNTLDFDLIHSHFIFPSGYYANKLSKKYKVPYIITSHEGDIENYLEKNSGIITPILQEASKIIAVSKINKDCISKKLPIITNNIQIINNFVDLTRFKITDKSISRNLLKIDQEKFAILNVANLIIDKKGQLDLVEIASKLRKENINACIYLIGKGPDREKIATEIKKRNLHSYVKLIGPLDNRELVNWYGAADLFVFPSYYESFGIVQIEALACGVPVIAYANEGSKEVLANYKNNLIKIGAIGDLFEKIKEALENPDLNSEKGKEERRKHVENNFSAEKAKRLIIDSYAELINQPDQSLSRKTFSKNPTQK